MVNMGLSNLRKGTTKMLLLVKILYKIKRRWAYTKCYVQSFHGNPKEKCKGVRIFCISIDGCNLYCNDCPYWKDL